MADDDKGPGSDDNTPPEQQLQKVLEARWDPSKLSRFMRSSDSSRGRALDYHQRSRFEGRFGVNLSNVRVFTGELAEEITRAHGAEALTVGDTGIILMRGSTGYAAGSARGTALLAHELTHVAQAMPSKISLMAPTANPLAKDHAEAEAEHVEGEVHGEEQGAHSKPQDAAETARQRETRRDLIKEMVTKMLHEDLETVRERSGRTFRVG